MSLKFIKKFGILIFPLLAFFISVPSSLFAQTVIATVSVQTYPVGVSVNPDTNLIYVSNFASSSVSVIDGITNSVVNTIPVGTGAEGISVNPSNDLVYLATGFNFVKVIDATTNTVATTIPVQTASSGVATNPITNRIYVTNRGCCPGNSVSVIDSNTNSVISTIPVGFSPRAVAINTSTNKIYVANSGSNSVFVIDGLTNTILNSIPINAPYEVKVNPVTNLIYVSNHIDRRVEVINGSTNTVSSTISPSFSPAYSMGINPSTNRLYVTDSSHNRVAIFDLNNNSFISYVPVGTTPGGGSSFGSIAVNQITGRVYVANFNSNDVSVIQDNEVPSVDAGGPYQVNEGNSVEVTAVGSDPNEGDVLTYAWDLDNNGSFETPGQAVNFSATNLDGPSSYTISAQVTDQGGLVATDQATVEVLNVAPSVGAITAPVDPNQVNTAVNTSTTFTDSGVLDTHTAVWNWGDGTISTGTVTESNGSGTVFGNHTYTSAGVYSVSVTVTDDDNGSGQSTFDYVVVYDPAPSGGFLTASGKYDSLSGWYTPDSQVQGDVKFGIQAQYNGGSTPTGQTKLTFKDYDIEFQSISYQWLVVTGNKAVLKGNGTINGSGNYTLLVSAIEDSPDTIRFQIKDGSTVIYDTQAGAAETQDPTTLLTSGSIQVH